MKVGEVGFWGRVEGRVWIWGGNAGFGATSIDRYATCQSFAYHKLPGGDDADHEWARGRAVQTCGNLVVAYLPVCFQASNIFRGITSWVV